MIQLRYLYLSGTSYYAKNPFLSCVFAGLASGFTDVFFSGLYNYHYLLERYRAGKSKCEVGAGQRNMTLLGAESVGVVVVWGAGGAGGGGRAVSLQLHSKSDYRAACSRPFIHTLVRPALLLEVELRFSPACAYPP